MLRKIIKTLPLLKGVGGILLIALAALSLSNGAFAASDRVTEYAESTGESTTTSTSYQDKVTLTFTPDDNSDYVYIATALVQNDSTSLSSDVILINTTDAVTFGARFVRERNPADYYTAVFMGKESFGVSPGSKTIKIQFRSETSSTITSIKDARIFAIKLTAADEYGESLTESTTTSTTFQNKHDLVFTPATTGDYLIIWVAQIQQTNTADAVQARILHSSTEYGLTESEPKAVTDYFTVGSMVKLNLANSSQTISSEFRQQRGSTAKIKNSRILALRLDEFHSNEYKEVRSQITTTSSTYVDVTGIGHTFTPAAQDYLEIYTAQFSSNGKSADNIGGHQARRGGSAVQGEFVKRPKNANDIVSFFLVKKQTETASSRTYDIQHKTTSATTKSTDTAMAFLQLTAAPTGWTGKIDGVTDPGKINGVANTSISKVNAQ